VCGGQTPYGNINACGQTPIFRNCGYHNTARPTEIDYRVGGPGNPSAIRKRGNEYVPATQTIIVLGSSEKQPKNMVNKKPRRKKKRFKNK